MLNSNEENPEANFAMAMSAIRERQFALAEQYLRVCLKVQPRQPTFLNNLSIVCRKQQKYQEAEEFARKALELAPYVPEVKQTLQDALHKAP